MCRVSCSFSCIHDLRINKTHGKVWFISEGVRNGLWKLGLECGLLRAADLEYFLDITSTVFTIRNTLIGYHLKYFKVENGYGTHLSPRMPTVELES